MRIDDKPVEAGLTGGGVRGVDQAVPVLVGMSNRFVNYLRGVKSGSTL